MTASESTVPQSISPEARESEEARERLPDPVNPKFPDEKPPSRKRQRSSSLPPGQMYSIKGLDSGWELFISKITYLSGVEYNKLQAFWSSVSTNAKERIIKRGPELKNFSFKSKTGALQLQLQSQQEISWTWVLDFAQRMMASTKDHFGALFSGEAYSNLFDVPAIGIELKILK